MVLARRRITTISFIEELLLAFILNMNAVKLVIGYTGNDLTYALFIAFAAAVLLHALAMKKTKLKIDSSIFLVLALFLVYAGITMLWSGVEDAVSKLLKFVAGIIIAYLASLLEEDSRVNAIKISMLISTVYSLYLIANYNFVYWQIIRSIIYNYLFVTLPVGLGLSFALVFTFMTKSSLWRKLYLALSIIIQTFALLQFPARGNLIFPLLITAILLIYKSRKNVKRLVLSLLVIAALFFILYTVTIRHGNDVLILRFTRLIENKEAEKRVPLYEYYLGHIIQHGDYLIGQGFGAASEVLSQGGFHEQYPHNFIIELVGEMGVFGIALLTTISVKLIKNEKLLLNNISAMGGEMRENRKMRFAVYNAGLFFYLFTYFKSYSIYDGYQLFIFIAFLLHSSTSQES